MTKYGKIMSKKNTDVQSSRRSNDMKSTGIVRPVDELGRIVLPKELRINMDINKKGDSVEIFIDDDKIVLKKYHPACIFCGNADDVVYLKGKLVCRQCINELNTI